MRVITNNGTIEGVELTRRNLRALLAKLDGNPPNSQCTLVDETVMLFVKAVEDVEHYTDRPAGYVHAATLASMKEQQS